MSRGELLRLHVETSKLADLNEDVNLKLIHFQTVLLLLDFFFTPQHYCINTSGKTPPNYRLNRDSLDEAEKTKTKLMTNQADQAWPRRPS